MTYLRPSYAIELGSTELSGDTLGPLIALEVSSAVNGPSDCAVVRLGAGNGSPPEPGEDATVELGWDDETERVFTGAVAWTESRVDSVEVVCLGTAMELVGTRSDQAFLEQSAGDIVTALASEAGVPTGDVEDGVQLPVYLVDSSSSHYEHCLSLARMSGADLYTTADGDLAFVGPSLIPSLIPDHLLRYGADVVELQAWAGRAVPGARVVPESPSSTMGGDSASWVSKASGTFAGNAGDAPETLSAHPVLRSKEAAQTTADALAALRERDATGATVRLMGRADIGLGDKMGFLGIDSLDSLYQVKSVTHRLDRVKGFRTSVTIAEA